MAGGHIELAALLDAMPQHAASTKCLHQLGFAAASTPTSCVASKMRHAADVVRALSLLVASSEFAAALAACPRFPTRAVLRLLQVAATAETPSHPEATAARVVEQMQQFVRRANEQTVLPADTHLRISFEGAVAIAARQFDAPKRSVRVRTRMHSKLIILSQRQFLSRRLPRTRLPR